MKQTFILIFSLIAGTAQAHTGHLTDVAGHDHWVAGAALGAAIAIALWAGLKSKNKAKSESDDQAEDADQVDEDELQEA